MNSISIRCRDLKQANEQAHRMGGNPVRNYTARTITVINNGVTTIFRY